MALKLLARHCHALAGCLFLITAEGPSYAAEFGNVAPSESWREDVVEYLSLQSELLESDGDRSALRAFRWFDERHDFEPILLSHGVGDTSVITGLALLALPGEVDAAELASTISSILASQGAMTLGLGSQWMSEVV